MTTTKPSAGAVRAAKEIAERITGYESDVPLVAEAIDRESGLAEALDALRGLYGLVQDGVLVRDTSKDQESNWSVKAIGIVQKLAAAEAVIARQNSNAEPVQSYPTGRWTEKGTV